MWGVTLQKRKWFGPIDNLRMARNKGYVDAWVMERVGHDGILWCPRTENMTWLARRNGHCYFTGPTTPSAPAPATSSPAPDSDRGRDLIRRARQVRHDAGVGFGAMARQLGVSNATLHIALAGAHPARPVPGVGGGGLPGRLLRAGCLIRGGLPGDGVVARDAAMAVRDGLLHVVTQVISHVPPAGDLPGAERVTPGSVPADQLDAGVRAEPAGEGAGLPAGQDAGDAVAVHVHQDAGVRLAAPLGPVAGPPAP